MDKIEAYSLFSGSSGNCTYIRTRDAELLIDAGVSARAVEKALREIGSSLDRISAIFVTHEHVDHTRGLEVISKKYHIPTHMTESSARAWITDVHASLLGDLYLHPISFSVRFADTTVRSFSVPHDSAAAVGYTVEYSDAESSEKLGIATDMGHIDADILSSLTGADAVMIEANHDMEMLLAGPYPYSLKRRILSDRGHLSNEACGELARLLAERGTKSFLLEHLSKDNNYPPTAQAAVRAALSEFDGIALAIAERDKPTKLV